MSALTKASWVNVGLHGLGLLLAVVGLREGSTAEHPSARMAALAPHPILWTLGWSVWALCALAFVTCAALLARRLPSRAGLGLAVVLGAVGAGIDLLCDVVQIFVLPDLASGSPEVFRAFERLAGAGGLVVANGLYSLSVLVAVLATGPADRDPAALSGLARAAGVGSFAGGVGLVVAGWVASATLLQGATGAAIGFYGLWLVLSARDLEAPSGPSVPAAPALAAVPAASDRG